MCWPMLSDLFHWLRVRSPDTASMMWEERERSACKLFVTLSEQHHSPGRSGSGLTRSSWQSTGQRLRRNQPARGCGPTGMDCGHRPQLLCGSAMRSTGISTAAPGKGKGTAFGVAATAEGFSLRSERVVNNRPIQDHPLLEGGVSLYRSLFKQLASRMQGSTSAPAGLQRAVPILSKPGAAHRRVPRSADRRGTG